LTARECVVRTRRVVSSRGESLPIAAADRCSTRRAAPVLDLPVSPYPAACSAARRLIADPSD
jgi:hypothetical protein